eukprot:scaffold1403_cov381-Prasinococcus_capsulatus_cf.AAC.2
MQAIEWDTSCIPSKPDRVLIDTVRPINQIFSALMSASRGRRRGGEHDRLAPLTSPGHCS